MAGEARVVAAACCLTTGRLESDVPRELVAEMRELIAKRHR